MTLTNTPWQRLEPLVFISQKRVRLVAIWSQIERTGSGGRNLGSSMPQHGSNRLAQTTKLRRVCARAVQRTRLLPHGAAGSDGRETAVGWMATMGSAVPVVRVLLGFVSFRSDFSQQRPQGYRNLDSDAGLPNAKSGCTVESDVE